MPRGRPSSMNDVETSATRQRDAGGRLPWLLMAVLGAMGVAGFYLWTLQSARGVLVPQGGRADYYNLLVDGFQAGHLHSTLR